MGTHNDCQESNIIFQQKLREKIESTFSQLDDIGDDTRIALFIDNDVADPNILRGRSELADRLHRAEDPVRMSQPAQARGLIDPSDIDHHIMQPVIATQLRQQLRKVA